MLAQVKGKGPMLTFWVQPHPDELDRLPPLRLPSPSLQCSRFHAGIDGLGSGDGKQEDNCPGRQREGAARYSLGPARPTTGPADRLAPDQGWGRNRGADAAKPFRAKIPRAAPILVTGHWFRALTVGGERSLRARAAQPFREQSRGTEEATRCLNV